MRLLTLLSATAVVSATFVALPVTALPTAQAAPVAPTVNRLQIDLPSSPHISRTQDGVAAASAPGDVAPVVVEQDDVAPFSVIGFSWDEGSPAPGLEVKVRQDGAWSDWQVLGANDSGPDAGSAEAAVAAGHRATEPLLSGMSDAFQVRVTPGAGELPTGLTAVTVDPGESPADATLSGSVPLATADAAGGAAPAIISRAQWGADEKLRTSKPGCTTPSYSSTIKVAIVHHTASTNDYDAAGAAAQVRGIYAYHVNGNGWCDVGYNFLVDKFGRVFEGRFGGVSRPVVGAHAGGFNKDTFGVSAIGEYGAAAAPGAMTDAIGRVVGWKLGLHNRPPLGRQTLVSAGGGTSKYAAGQSVSVNTVIGHRDVGSTSCPGTNLYNRLGTIRTVADVVALQTDTRITAPDPANQQVAYAGRPALFTAYVPSAQSWEVTLVEECTGRTVRRYTGYVEPGTMGMAWDLKEDSGSWARGGAYVWYLRTAAGGSASGRVEVVPPRETPAAVPFTGGVSNAGFVATTPARVHDSRLGTTQPLGAGGNRNIQVIGGSTGVPSSGVAAVALNVTAVCATQPSFVSAWPAGSSRPATSSLNVGAGDTVPGLVVVPVGSDGRVSLSNDAGTTHLLVDVIGYFPVSGGSTLRTVAPVRVLDAASSGPMVNGESRTVDVAAKLGVPRANLTGAVVNVTISGATAPGNVLVHPAGPAPGASTANVVMGRDVSNRSMVATADGRITIRATGGQARVFVDVVGYFSTAAGGSRYTSVAPGRLLDTRYGPGQRAAVGAGETIGVTVAGVGAVPAGAIAVLGTLTSDRTTTPTHLRAWGSGGQRPATSDLNPWPGVAAANAVVLPVGTGRSVQVYNNSGSTHVILDVVGYFS